MNRLFTAGCVLALGLVLPAFAQDTKGKDEKPNPAAKNLNRNIDRHKLFLKRIEDSKGKGDVIFLGDSITEGWEGNGRKAWKEYFGEFEPVNLGIGGDQTGHVLWRITEGKELEHLKPKVAVIMIGTNNGHSPAHVAGGIKAIVEELKKQKPHIKILVLGVFPRGSGVKGDKSIPAAKLSKKVPAINAIIAKLDDGKTVFYKDIGNSFLAEDGGLSRDIMDDYLHLTAKGYAIWGKAIKGDIEKLLK